MENNRRKIRLIALDLDGTLLNRAGRITDESKRAIAQAAAAGITVVVSTGRDYDAIFPKQLCELGIRYAITTNGSSLYRIADRVCLYENGMQGKDLLPVLAQYRSEKVYYELYIDGTSYTEAAKLDVLGELDLDPYLLAIMKKKCNSVENLGAYLLEKKCTVQKGALIFSKEARTADGKWEQARQFLTQQADLHAVDGGCNNLEFTKKWISKAVGLRWIAGQLGIRLEETMAIGDSENDWEMLAAAGLGVAMGNASLETQAKADAVTQSNEEDGVATAIWKYAVVQCT